MTREELEALAVRCEALLHPQTGLCRGMLSNSGKPYDQPGDIIPTKAGELTLAAEVLTACVAAFRSLQK